MRSVTVHPEKSIRFTAHAEMWCVAINNYKRLNPDKSFAQVAEALDLSESSARRYYYGVHHKNGGMWGPSYNQVRRGACCPIHY